MRNFFIVLACAIVAAMSLQARGATIMLEANLDGLQETSPNGSPGFGSVDVNLDTITGAVSVTSGSYQGLLGSSFSVSLCGPAAPGVTGPKFFPLTLDSPGAMTGTISGGGTLPAGNINDAINGNTYINIFTNVFLSGEIRGQLIAVPEPATLMTFAAAGGLLLRRRRA
jgi:CHRD domain